MSNAWAVLAGALLAGAVLTWSSPPARVLGKRPFRLFILNG
jgi:hypothetical protein